MLVFKTLLNLEMYYQSSNLSFIPTEYSSLVRRLKKIFLKQSFNFKIMIVSIYLSKNKFSNNECLRLKIS